MKQVRTVAQQLTTAIQGSQYGKAHQLLLSLPHDDVLPTLVCVFDECLETRKLSFVKFLEPALLRDAEVMSTLGLEKYIVEAV